MVHGRWATDPDAPIQPERVADAGHAVVQVLVADHDPLRLASRAEGVVQQRGLPGSGRRRRPTGADLLVDAVGGDPGQPPRPVLAEPTRHDVEVGGLGEDDPGLRVERDAGGRRQVVAMPDRQWGGHRGHPRVQAAEQADGERGARGVEQQRSVTGRAVVGEPRGDQACFVDEFAIGECLPVMGSVHDGDRILPRRDVRVSLDPIHHAVAHSVGASALR